MRFWRRLLRRKGTIQEVTTSPTGATLADFQTVYRLGVGQGTHIGRMRQTNEDTLLVLHCLTSAGVEIPSLGLLIVADGMGGHLMGEEASTLAAKVAAGVVVGKILVPVLTSQNLDIAKQPILEILAEAATSANTAVSEMPSDAGTTLTLALILGHSVYVAHVGDTRAYYLDGSGLHQITQDHSLVNRLVELGQISAQEAQVHPQRNFLYRALGQGPELQVDTCFRLLGDGSHLILCSDGLWTSVSEEEIVGVIGTSSSPQEACDRLIDRADEQGGEDDITVVLARIDYG